MRGLDINQKRGAASVVLLLFGLTIVLGSIFLLFLNNEFSAFGFAEITGGDIQPTQSVYWIGVKMVSGGAFGLFAGWVTSILITVAQFIFWVLDPDIVFKQEKMFKRMIYALMVYDLLSTVYYLSQYAETTMIQTPFFGSFEVWTIKGLFALSGIVFIAFAFMSVGAEFWMALGITLVRLHLKPAMEQISDWGEEIVDYIESSRLESVDKRIDDYKQNYRPPQNRNNQYQGNRQQQNYQSSNS